MKVQSELGNDKDNYKDTRKDKDSTFSTRERMTCHESTTRASHWKTSYAGNDNYKEKAPLTRKHMACCESTPVLLLSLNSTITTIMKDHQIVPPSTRKRMICRESTTRVGRVKLFRNPSEFSWEGPSGRYITQSSQ